MKKRYLVGIILIVGALIFYMYNYLNKDEIVIMDEKKQVSTTSSISMMLETGESTGMYEVSSDTLWPDSSQYTFNETLSKCENGSSVSWDSTTGAVIVAGSTSDKCYIYFDVYIEPTYTINEILASKKISERTDFSVAFTDDTTGIVYETTDNDGYTYYWVGDATDNYVYFAGFYWRIVRVNGDGTLRLIYDGSKQAYENGEESEDRVIGSSEFNNIASYYSYYVGYTYTVGQQRPDEKNGGTDSTIKIYLDAWYSDNLEGTDYEEYIYQSGKFCNDREVYNGGSWSQYEVYYAAYGRLMTNKSPSLECTNDIDEYTLNIGLISADELSYSGAVYGVANTSYYLYTSYAYWTMTPFFEFDGTDLKMLYSSASYSLYHLVGATSNSLYVKPVINLNSDILLTGSGTIDSPYEVYMG